MSERNAVPATKAGSLLEELDAQRKEGISDFSLRRYRREAQRLIAVDAVGAHSLLGAVASLRGDTEAVRRHYRIALEQSGSAADVWHNYSISLSHVGEMDEAFHAASNASELAPDMASFFENLVEAAMDSANFQSAVESCEHFRKLRPKEALPHEPSARMMAEAVASGALNESLVRDALLIAHRARGHARLQHVRSAVFRDPLSEHSYVNKLYINTSPEAAASLNEQIADRIAEQGHLEGLGRSFVPLFIGRQIDGRHPRESTQGSRTSA